MFFQLKERSLYQPHLLNYALELRQRSGGWAAARLRVQLCAHSHHESIALFLRFNLSSP